jgi:hypothetical protein
MLQNVYTCKSFEPTKSNKTLRKTAFRHLTVFSFCVSASHTQRTQMTIRKFPPNTSQRVPHCHNLCICTKPLRPPDILHSLNIFTICSYDIFSIVVTYILTLYVGVFFWKIQFQVFVLLCTFFLRRFFLYFRSVSLFIA